MSRAALAILVVLAACAPGTSDELTRAAARAAIKPVLAERFPGLPVEPAVDCVIDNATGDEIVVLAADAVTGPTASTAEIVSRVISRPATVQCLATEGLPVLLSRL